MFLVVQRLVVFICECVLQSCLLLDILMFLRQWGAANVYSSRYAHRYTV